VGVSQQVQPHKAYAYEQLPIDDLVLDDLDIRNSGISALEKKVEQNSVLWRAHYSW
jgi:hypothetical protein